VFELLVSVNLLDIETPEPKRAEEKEKDKKKKHERRKRAAAGRLIRLDSGEGG